jgi:AraC-like DNA-binding protein
MDATSKPHCDLIGRTTRGVERVRVGNGRSGIERVEIRIGSGGFSPHRHDTYAIGLTFSGVQTFHYRGGRRHCLPGQCHVLHPDEIHDGLASDDAGFGYRILYVAPKALQTTLDGAPLPFVSDPIVNPGSGLTGLMLRLWDIHDDLDDVDDDEIIFSIAEFLQKWSGTSAKSRHQEIPWRAVSRVCERLNDQSAARCTATQLEAISGLDRWTLARAFRAAYGTSPRSFRTMRQLDRVRRHLVRGASAADAAAEAGFSDQSHMSRMFKRAYGCTPMQWVEAVRRA